ncbi:uncharacterized protein [Argopecten irradians]|uniref:uncharacterized protein n=1 Tax=Argopecten irradians TaxID=31199 RepID=UPI00371F3775
MGCILFPCRYQWIPMATVTTLMVLLATTCNYDIGLGEIPVEKQVRDGESYHKPQLNSDSFAFKTLLDEHILSLNNSTYPSYLVYDCSREWRGDCGGWSDRLVGIMTTFAISILTKRHFRIHFDKPSLLHDHLVSSNFDWRYNSSALTNGTHSYHNLLHNNHKRVVKYLTGEKDISSYFKHDVSFVRMNWDLTYNIRQRPNVASEIPWITHYHQADIYKHLYKFMFELSPQFVNVLNSHHIAQRKRNKIACAHIRVGQNPNMPLDAVGPVKFLEPLWKFFDSLNHDEYDLFIASDTDSIKYVAKARYPGNMIDTPGNITHIDQPHINDPDDGFQKQLLDFHILVNCDILIVPASGFSILAAFIRNTDSGLYCWKGKELLPCSRYTILDIFPGGKFNPTKPR